MENKHELTEKTGLEILRNYVPYAVPKKMIFLIETGVYGPDGWIRKKEQNIIIGETDDCYVTRLLKTVGCDRGDKTYYGKEFLLPIGIHKSRLYLPKVEQLQLF